MVADSFAVRACAPGSRRTTSVIIYLTRRATAQRGGAQFDSNEHRTAIFARPRRRTWAHSAIATRLFDVHLGFSRTSVAIDLTRKEGSARRRSSAQLDRHRGDLGTSASSHTSPLVVRAAMRLGHARSRRRHRSRCLLRAPGGFAPLAPFEPPGRAWTKPRNWN